MVPITTPIMPGNLDRIETNLKYLIELDLSDDDILKDPLSLAFYYHFLQKNDLENINRSIIVSWARNYCYQKIVQRDLSRKKDTEITAASLAYSTLKKDKGYPENKKGEIESNLKALLEKEKGKDGLFFARPNFTAIILYATRQAEIPITQEREMLQNLLLRYSDSRTLNNILGLPFLIQKLIDLKEDAQLEKLRISLQEKLKDNLLEYDDKAYLVCALWKCHENSNTLPDVRLITESTIDKTPITLSDIINKGDISDITVRQDNLKISRLYKAMLLDLLMNYKKHLTDLNERELDQRYSGDFNLRSGALATFSLIPIVITILAGYLLRDSLKAALSFWILQQTNTTWERLLANTFPLVLISYLALASIVGVYSLYSSIVRKTLIRDRRVWDHYRKHQLKALQLFCISFIGALIFGILSKLAANAFQDFLKR